MFIDDNAYEKLRNASRIRPLIPFVGAGVSQLAGCPGWDEFANGALRFFLDGGNKRISHAEFDQLKNLPSRIKLSLALDLERGNPIPIDFKNLLKSSSSERERFGDKVYDSLGLISETFVTTNYDEKLDTGTRKIFYNRDELTVENLVGSKSAVFHIHGSVREPRTMIRTTDEYLRLYANHDLARGRDGENPFLIFLDKLFETRTVLFIGYSLSELEVLEYVLQKKGAPTQMNFMLQGFFTHQKPLIESFTNYYKRFNVTLLPFCRDKNDWDELANVIEELARQLPLRPRLDISKLKEMEDLLK